MNNTHGEWSKKHYLGAEPPTGAPSFLGCPLGKLARENQLNGRDEPGKRNGGDEATEGFPIESTGGAILVLIRGFVVGNG